MKLATANFFVLGCLFILCISGCETTENLPTATPSVSATNDIVVKQNDIISTPSYIEKTSLEASYKPLATNSTPSQLIKFDQTFISQIEKKWVEHVQKDQVTLNKGVVVILKFHLNSDGTISDISTVKSTADEALVLICKKY